MTGVYLTNEQTNVLDGIVDRLKLSKQITIVSGYAGTGKTTIIAKLRPKVQNLLFLGSCNYIKSVAFVTLTGKASSVLREKIENIIYQIDYIGTLHSLIYEPQKEFDGTKWVIVGWKRKTKIEFDLIIVDEASMINNQMFKDLKLYDVPIIFFGDKFQLPPIGGDDDSILKNPDFQLTEVQRQAFQNPIVKIANDIRKDGKVKPGIYNKNIFKLPWNERTKKLFYSLNFGKSTIVLTGKNKTRIILNKSIRKKKKFNNMLLVPGDRLVCLANNPYRNIMNGELGTILWVRPQLKGYKKVDLEMDNLKNVYTTVVPTKHLNSEKPNLYHKKYKDTMKKLRNLNLDFFDYGYALTVHKSQGSEWDKVVLFEEKMNFFSDYFYARWLYTAVTRAKRKLFITY